MALGIEESLDEDTTIDYRFDAGDHTVIVGRFGHRKTWALVTDTTSELSGFLSKMFYGDSALPEELADTYDPWDVARLINFILTGETPAEAPGKRMTPYDQFEQLIEQNAIQYKPVPKSKLTKWERALIDEFLVPAKIEWAMGTKTIGSVRSFKLSHPYLQYLDINSKKKQFMWCTDDHHSASRRGGHGIITASDWSQSTSY